MSGWVLVLVAGLPLLALWIRSIVEVARRPSQGVGWRAIWLLILVLLPVVGLAAYVVARTPRSAGRSADRTGSGRAEQLVLAAEQRQRDDLDDAGFRDRVAELRHG